MPHQHGRRWQPPSSRPEVRSSAEPPQIGLRPRAPPLAPTSRHASRQGRRQPQHQPIGPGGPSTCQTIGPRKAHAAAPAPSKAHAKRARPRRRRKNPATPDKRQGSPGTARERSAGWTAQVGSTNSGDDQAEREPQAEDRRHARFLCFPSRHRQGRQGAVRPPVLPDGRGSESPHLPVRIRAMNSPRVAGLSLKPPRHGAGGGDAVGLADPADRHARVPRLEDVTPTPLGARLRPSSRSASASVSAFLHLRPTRQDLDCPRQLAQPGDPAVGRCRRRGPCRRRAAAAAMVVFPTPPFPITIINPCPDTASPSAILLRLFSLSVLEVSTLKGTAIFAAESAFSKDRSAGTPTMSTGRSGTSSRGSWRKAAGISTMALSPCASNAAATASSGTLAWNTPFTRSR